MSSKFDLTREVPSLKLCKELKELGYPQDGGGWYWVDLGGMFKPYIEWLGVSDEPHDDYYIKAPTFSELGEWLPPDIHLVKIEKNKWLIADYASAHCGDYPKFENDNPLNIMAQMLIWLSKNGYISFNK